ncbi:MAG: PPOX class F420-dependent oxidoreductase [Ornithinimicrobium sp.]
MTQPQVPGKFADFLSEHRKGVLVTLKRDGRPQLSNVLYAFDADRSRISMSVTADRAKTRNAARDPRVSLHVSSPDFWAYAVAEGDAVLGEPARDPDDASADALVEVYRTLAGEHDKWQKFREVQVLEQRLVLSIDVRHAYGMVRG